MTTTFYGCNLSHRYSPLMPNNERQRIFSVDGVHVGSDYFCNNKTCTIHLDNLSSETSGYYRCEVSGDAPEFKLAHDGNNMTIVGELFFNCRKSLRVKKY